MIIQIFFLVSSIKTFFNAFLYMICYKIFHYLFFQLLYTIMTISITYTIKDIENPSFFLDNALHLLYSLLNANVFIIIIIGRYPVHFAMKIIIFYL